MLFTAVYLLCFALLLVGALSLMSQGFRAGSASPAGPRATAGRRRHPEAPEPGEAVLYLDLNRERLEQLYEKSA
jgi:hypothetical protein